MKIASPKRKSTDGRQSKLKPGNKTAAKPKKQRVEQNTAPAQTIKDSELRYHRLFENMLNGLAYCKMIFEHGQPQDFIYLDVNNAFESLTGLKNVVGKKVSEVIPGIKKSDPGLFEIYGRVALTGKSERFETYVEAMKMWFLISVYCPEKEYFVAVFDVITERKQAEQKIKNLAKFPDENPFPILRLNERGIILYANLASVEVLKDWKAAVGSEAPAVWRKKVTEVLKSRSNQVVDIPVGMRIISFVVVPVIEANYVNLYGRDITERKQAEERIAYQAQLLANVNDAIVASDENYRMTTWNASAESMYGWKAEEVLGRNGTEFLQTEWPQADAAEMRRKIAGTGHWRGEASQRCKDGTRIPVELSTIVLHDESGGITGYASVNRSITERKQAEETLRLENERFLRFTNSNIIGIVIADPGGKILLANDYYLNILGVTRQDFLDGKVDWKKVTPPEWLAADEKAITELRERGICKPYEKEYERADGTRVPVYLAHAMLPGAGEQIAAFVLDITERKRAEDELRRVHDELELQVQQRTAALSQSNMLLQTLLDNMPDQIYFKDLGSRFIKNSRAQANALGLSDPSEVVGKTDFDFFPHAQRSYDEEQEIIRTGNPLVDFEEWVVWPDGHETWVSTTKVPLRDQGGEIIGTFGISRDITDRKRNEEALRKARDELEAFSYSVSHDLRAPLRGIDGWSQALLEDYGGQLDEQGQEYIRRVRSETQHMGELIDDLLQLSRITRAEMHSERVDLSAIARSIAARLRDSEPQRRVEFVIQDGLSAIGDAHLIEVVLTNLLGNAFKFTGKTPEAHIEFGLMNMDGQRVFFVHDNGAGFDMTYAKKLFGAFQRMHKESEFSGTGIGLATVQRIINRHGGRIWAEAAVDQGATFFFTL